MWIRCGRLRVRCGDLSACYVHKCDCYPAGGCSSRIASSVGIVLVFITEADHSTQHRLWWLQDRCTTLVGDVICHVLCRNCQSNDFWAHTFRVQFSKDRFVRGLRACSNVEYERNPAHASFICPERLRVILSAQTNASFVRVRGFLKYSCL